MKRIRLTRQIATWVALFASLLLAFGPSLNTGFMQLPGVNGQWVEMCSATGNKFIFADAAGRILSRADALTTNQKKPGHGEHCSLCVSAGDLPVLLPFIQGPGHQSGSSFLQAPVFYPIPDRFWNWTPIQSRAPPQFHHQFS